MKTTRRLDLVERRMGGEKVEMRVINNSFEEFLCEEEERNGGVAEGEGPGLRAALDAESEEVVASRLVRRPLSPGSREAGVRGRRREAAGQRIPTSTADKTSRDSLSIH